MNPSDLLQYGAFGLAVIIFSALVLMMRWMMHRLDKRYEDVIVLNSRLDELTAGFTATVNNFSVLVGNHLDHQEERMAIMAENQETIAETLERACVSHSDTVAAVNRLCAMWGNGGVKEVV
jgi:hypothetical protein